MVGDLLQLLFTQKLKNCNNISLKEKVRPDFADGKPVPVITVVLALSLVSIFSNPKSLFNNNSSARRQHD